MSKTEGSSKSMQLVAIALIMLCVGVAVGYSYGQSQIPPPKPATTVTVTATPSKRVTLLEKITQRGYVIVGTSADYPPYESIDPNSKKIVGLDVDITEAIARELNIAVKWEDMPFESLIGALEAGKVDIINAGIGLKAERMAKLAYSIPYQESSTNVLVVKDDSSVKPFTDLAEVGKLKLKIGVQTGTIQESIISDLVKEGKVEKDNMISYINVDLMMTDLNTGRIGTAMIDKPVADSWAKRIAIRIVYFEWAPPKCLWLLKGERELLDAIDTALLKLHKNGTIQELLNKWLG